MDLTQDLLVALSGKTPEQIQSAIDTADATVRTVVMEVKPEWPVVSTVDDVTTNIPQEWPVPIREALAEIAVQVLTGQAVIEPVGLRNAIAEYRVVSEV